MARTERLLRRLVRPLALGRAVWALGFAALATTSKAAGGTEPARAEPRKRPEPTEMVRERLPPLAVSIGPNDVDVAAGQLTLRMSRPAARVTLRALSLSGAELARSEQAFDGEPAGSPLVVHWNVPEGEAVARIEVFAYDTSNYFKGVAITPWSFEIPHEDVVFDTDSAEIRPSEAGKLRASLDLIQKQLPRAKHLGSITLYIVAHTDTVGSAEYNLQLSARRARALAHWFRGHGLRTPIAFAGVGEGALRVKTGDEVDEPRNRRADYMLGLEPPRFKGSGVSPEWQRE